MSEFCPICTESFSTDNEKFCVPHCNHVFCNTCIKIWARQSVEPTCPVCRKSFSRALVISDGCVVQEIELSHGRFLQQILGPCAGFNALLSAGQQDVLIFDIPDNEIQQKSEQKTKVQFFYNNIRSAKNRKRNKRR